MTYQRLCQHMGCGLPSEQRIPRENGGFMYVCAAHAKRRGDTVLRYRGRRMYK